MDVYLSHHGIIGMKWGVRRYQNPDGSLTPAGQRRLDKKDNKWAKKNYDKIVKMRIKGIGRARRVWKSATSRCLFL